jgi:hypothetical protein
MMMHEKDDDVKDEEMKMMMDFIIQTITGNQQQPKITVCIRIHDDDDEIKHRGRNETEKE